MLERHQKEITLSSKAEIQKIVKRDKVRFLRPLAMTSTKTNPSLAAYMTTKDRTSTAELLRALGADR